MLTLLTIGLISGLFIGMIGTGAGILMIPGMVYLAGLQFKEAVGITLLMQTLPVGVVGAYQYWTNNLLPMTPALLIAAGMLGGITLGGFFVNAGYINENVLRSIFGLIAIGTGSYVLITG